MYAVIKAGGKQHRVRAGDVIEIELMHGEEEVSFSPLLVVDDDGKAHVGKEIAKAVVRARLVGEKKGEKVKIFKYRPKTGYSRRQGHRQAYTLAEIREIEFGGVTSTAPEASENGEAAEEPAPAKPRARRSTKTTGSASASKAAEETAAEEAGEIEGSGGAEEAGEAAPDSAGVAVAEEAPDAPGDTTEETSPDAPDSGTEG
jgi:large subunit ribosomal protein L21